MNEFKFLLDTSTCIELYGMSVITHNVKHFTRINGLTVLDWTELANDAGCADSLL